MQARHFVCSVCAIASCLVVSSEARADIYISSELWVEARSDDIQLTSHVTAEDSECSGGLIVQADILDPAGSVVAGGTSQGNASCSDTAESQYAASYDSFGDGNYTSRGTASSAGGTHGCVDFTADISVTNSVFRYSHFNSLIGKHEYHRDSAVCAHSCQAPQVCADVQGDWASVPGARVSYAGLTLCYWSGTVIVQSSQPECKPNTLGAYGGGFNDHCG
jgi:hypothetical protein